MEGGNIYSNLKRNGIFIGAIVLSQAGHDIDTMYLVINIKEKIAFLADGRKRGADNPKRKRVSHMKILGAPKDLQETIQMMNNAKTNEEKNIIIRKTLSDFLKSLKNNKERE